ncbi:MAG: orotidine-5'-phosphate decarboxylase [Pelotomaculum sp.]|uniref:Orotidine 5'-phosphate decarboxylase n=1 Tax=Pelotomaculum thermopropionicum (strain DSM 13744 / JCM 10971 / SI) TaxID=370438 RepID=A5D198_PELTS|nr:orotidine-5'-phosphate decarboxylase [Pelotomaculum sp.]BAF59986.1 orotidine-5'-phosphate decarboxylase [Pelotomaculum thermopropionicum SI]
MSSSALKPFKNPLIIALDVDTAEEAVCLAGRLGPYAGGFKVGMQLFYSAGPEAVRRLREKKAPVFLDLKLHDIPNTAAAAARALARLGVSILNVHAAGGRAMMQAAAEAAREEAEKAGINRPLVVAVTVLTSMDQEMFNKEAGMAGPICDRVAAWSLLAREAGLDGVVASPREIEVVRKACGPGFVIITPGIRPSGAARDDQKRTMTPREAIALGANWLVVGRPVTAAADPVKAIKDILDDIKQIN